MSAIPLNTTGLRNHSYGNRGTQMLRRLRVCTNRRMGISGRASAYVTYVAGLCVVWEWDHPGVGAALAAVFAKHAAPHIAADRPAQRIRIVVCSTAQAKGIAITPVPTRGRHFWRCVLPREVADDLPNRIYYAALQPTLVRALTQAGRRHLHAACLHAAWSGTILILGPSGAGKSTVAIGWGAGGGEILTDDSAFLVGRGLASRCYGLRRPLHLDPAVLQPFSGLNGIFASREYLPGRRKLAYDWWDAYPNRALLSAPCPAHIVLSSIGGKNRSVCHRIRREQRLRELQRTQALGDESDQRIVQSTIRRLLRVPTARWWRIVWGTDVLKVAGFHYNLMQRLISTGS